MAIGYGRLTPVKKAGSTIARAAHHGGHRLSHGAAGRAAYLSGERIVGNDIGMVTDYRGKFGVEHSELVLPGGGTCDREKFWNAVDAHKTQSPNATVARDLIIAFPHEFSFDDRKAAACELARWIADRYQVAVDYGLHLPETHKGSSEKNYHGHFLISERTVSPTGELGKIQRDLNQMVCQQIDEKRGRLERKPTAGQEIRMAWERIANDALERGGHSERVDMHTRNRVPSKHLGAAETRRLRDQAYVPAVQRTVADLRRELIDAQRELEMRMERASKRIRDIQDQRRIAATPPSIASGIGNIDRWQQDTAKEFIRAWEAGDRAAKLRREIRDARRIRGALRDPTPEEARILKGAGREKARVRKLESGIEECVREVEKLDPSTTIDVEQRNGRVTQSHVATMLSAISRAAEREGPELERAA